MYVELGLLFLIYCFSVIALAVSIYALWTLEEIKQFYKKLYQQKPKKATPPPPIKVQRPKGHWD
jgi:hypothetical protein